LYFAMVPLGFVTGTIISSRVGNRSSVERMILIDADMVAALDDIVAVSDDGRNLLTLRVTCAWNPEKESFDPVWQFLDAAGQPMPERRRAINLIGFFNYMPLYWLGALRDAADEFTPRSDHWRTAAPSAYRPSAPWRRRQEGCGRRSRGWRAGISPDRRSGNPFFQSPARSIGLATFHIQQERTIWERMGFVRGYKTSEAMCF
jgi:hypothetical protein